MVFLSCVCYFSSEETSYLCMFLKIWPYIYKETCLMLRLRFSRFQNGFLKNDVRCAFLFKRLSFAFETRCLLLRRIIHYTLFEELSWSPFYNFFFETKFPSVAQANLELLIFPPQIPECWYKRHLHHTGLLHTFLLLELTETSSQYLYILPSSKEEIQRWDKPSGETLPNSKGPPTPKDSV